MPPRIDLRSDTVTRPDAAMRAAMADAEVGDDVLEGDPTVRALEEHVAGMLGFDGGVLVASGTMGNLVAQLAHRVHGRAILAGAHMHVRLWEGGGHAALAGAPLALCEEAPDGVPDPDEAAARCAVDDPHQPRVGLAWVENTHGGMGGLPVTPAAVGALRDALPDDLPLHHDGARLVDAALALDLEPHELLGEVTSTTLCLSKGLGCPVGTVVCGEEAFVAEARRARKLVGGAMRQAGVVAAAGLLVLDEEWERTTTEMRRAHAQARRIALALAELPAVCDVHGGAYDPAQVRTNLVRFGVGGDRDRVVAGLAGRGVGVLPYGPGIRAVTHRCLDDAEVDEAITALRAVLA